MNTKIECSNIDRYAIAKELYRDNDLNLKLLPLRTLRTFFDRCIYDYLPKEGCVEDYFSVVEEELSIYGECFVVPNEGKVKKLFAQVIQDTFLSSYKDEQLSNSEEKAFLKAHFEKEQESIKKAFNEAFDKFVDESKWKEKIEKEATEILKKISEDSHEIKIDYDQNGDLNLDSIASQLDSIGISKEKKEEIINQILQQIKNNPAIP